MPQSKPNYVIFDKDDDPYYSIAHSVSGALKEYVESNGTRDIERYGPYRVCEVGPVLKTVRGVEHTTVKWTDV